VRIGKNAKQPVLEGVPVIVLMEEPEGTDRGFLKKVLSVVWIAGESVGEIVSGAMAISHVAFETSVLGLRNLRSTDASVGFCEFIAQRS
jgi:hypothetical protein